MANLFQVNDPSIESQWRAIILFGKNSATFKFAFAKSLLELADKERTRIALEDLSIPFANNIVNHLKKSDKQGRSGSSKFLGACRKFIRGEISESVLYDTTQQLGFVNVVDAFHNVRGGAVPNVFYEKNYQGKSKEIVITDNLLRLKELFVNGVLQDEKMGFFSSDLTGHLINGENERENIKVNLSGAFRINCRLFINDKKIEVKQEK